MPSKDEIVDQCPTLPEEEDIIDQCPTLPSKDETVDQCLTLPEEDETVDQCPTLPREDEIVVCAYMASSDDDPLLGHQVVGTDAGQASLSAERQGTEEGVELQVQQYAVDLILRTTFWRR